MKYFTCFLFPFCLLAVSCVSVFAEEKPAGSFGKNLAHRGMSYLAPENTLMAFKLAIQSGANSAECDVHRSADGVLVLSHDRNMKRTMGLDADITSKTFAEIRRQEAGKWKGKHFEGEPIPTLEEYLHLMKGSGCTPVIEIKQEGIEKDVVEMVRKFEMVGDVVIVTFSTKSLARVRDLEPRIRLGLNYSRKIEGDPEAYADEIAETILSRCKPLDIKAVSIAERLLSKKLVDLLHRGGIEIWCWIVNDPDRMNEVLDLGVDTVCSDRPEIVAEVLRKR